jgi:hypothetical protein
MIKPLFETAPLCALPFLIVGFAQENRVFGRNNARPLRQRHDFVLHHFFDRLCDFDNKRFGSRARLDLRVARRFF